jgi:hypothetical protein
VRARASWARARFFSRNGAGAGTEEKDSVGQDNGHNPLSSGSLKP